MMYGVRVNAYFTTNTKIEFQSAWLFTIPIYKNILPVQRIVSRLILDVKRLHFQCSSKKYCNSNGLCKQYMNNPDLFYCYCYQQWYGNQCQFRIPTSSIICSKESMIIYDSTQNKSICICPLSKIGPTCRVCHPYNFCHNDSVKCKNNGICSVNDVRSSLRMATCLCTEQYGDNDCGSEVQQVTLTLSSSLSLNKDLSAIVYYFVEFLPRNKTILSISKYRTSEEEASFVLYIYATKLITINFKSITTIYIRPHIRLPYLFEAEKHFLSIVQVYLSNFSQELYYYNHNYTRQPVQKLNAFIGYDKCLSIRELLNSTVLQYHPLKRLKYYQQPCLQQLTTCFYDDVYLCLCNRQYNFSACYLFSFNRSECLINSCENQGKCLQDDERSNALNYKCLCQPCYNGKLCQYSTSDYSLSLDVLISDDLNVHLGTKISEQSIIIQCCFYLIISFVFIGFIFNLLTLITFCQKRTRTAGGGVYLLILSIINQLNLFLFLIHFLFLVQFETTLYLCKFIEYFAKVLPSISDWLSVFVTMEGGYLCFAGAKFNKAKSKTFAKIMIILLITIQSIAYLHEFLFRRLIQDLLAYENNRQWCIISFDHFHWLKNYNVILNILNIVLPFLCSLICASFILIKQAFVARKFSPNQTYLMAIRNEFGKHKHLLIAPILLVLLNLPRVIFLFIFTCFNSSDKWQTHLLLTTHFLSFVPRLLTFFLFVLTSSLFKHELKLFFKRLRRSYRSVF